MMCASGIVMNIEDVNMFQLGYNKAIDDFVKAIVDRGLSANYDKYCITRYAILKSY